MTQDNDRIFAALPDLYPDSHLEIYRSWMVARVQELKREQPWRSKKGCRQIAGKEWLELRRQHKREQREKSCARAGRPARPMPFGR
jgi:hypothetical protein